MDLLVVGCGYLGQRVAARWPGRVFVTTRRPEAADAFRSRGWTPIVCDVTRPETLRQLPVVDTVAYSIALDRRSGAAMRDVYVGGLTNVLAHLPRPRRFVHVSSSSVYGQSDGSWVDESSPTEPEEPAGQVVLETEQTLRATLPDVIVLRFSGIYGPGRLLRRSVIQAGEPIVADGDKWLNLIHVADGARAVLAAAECGTPGSTVNVCDDEPTPRREFYLEMARWLGAAEPKFVKPPADAATPPHERGNRRIRNRRMHDELGVTLAFPTFRAGLEASVAEERAISNNESLLPQSGSSPGGAKLNSQGREPLG
jgi:nucleoside-diphosphate-sugar epimerase